MKRLWTCRAVAWAVLAFLLSGCGAGTLATEPGEPAGDWTVVRDKGAEILAYIAGETETPPPLPVAEEGGSWLSAPLGLLHLGKDSEEGGGESQSPLAGAIKAMRERYPETSAAKRGQPCLGENARGYVEVRCGAETEEAERVNELQRLAAAENADRKVLYREFARLYAAEQLSVSDAESLFAMARLGRARRGTVVELPGPGADFEAFRLSAKGRRLGAACVPGAWVTLR